MWTSCLVLIFEVRKILYMHMYICERMKNISTHIHTETYGHKHMHSPLLDCPDELCLYDVWETLSSCGMD